MTWRQLGIHHKPCALLNVEGYFDPIDFEHGRQEGFLRGEPHGLLLIDDDPETLLSRVLSQARATTRMAFGTEPLGIALCETHGWPRPRPQSSRLLS